MANRRHRTDRAGKRPIGICSSGASGTSPDGIGAAEFVVCGDALFSNPEYSRRVREEAEGLPIEFTGWRDRYSRCSVDARSGCRSVRSGGGYNARDPGSVLGRSAGGGFSIGRDTGDHRRWRYRSACPAYRPRIWLRSSWSSFPLARRFLDCISARAQAPRSPLVFHLTAIARKFGRPWRHVREVHPGTFLLYAQAVFDGLHFEAPRFEALRNLMDAEWRQLIGFCHRTQLAIPFALRCHDLLPRWVADRFTIGLG